MQKEKKKKKPGKKKEKKERKKRNSSEADIEASEIGIKRKLYMSAYVWRYILYVTSYYFHSVLRSKRLTETFSVALKML